MVGDVRRARLLAQTLLSWFDSSKVGYGGDEPFTRLDWLRTAPYLAIHAACLGVLWVGASPVAVAASVVLFAVRMLAITGFYHRYFAHRSFKTSRPLQLVFAAIGAAAAQRGPLWWAAHHRQHHATAERADDPHSPARLGFWWSHTGWFLAPANYPLRAERVRDWLRFPELRFLDRFDSLVPIVLALALYAAGEWLEARWPALGTSGAQLFVWGFCISTVALYHSTFAINSLAHRWGRRRYATADDSRNNFWLALLTFGEGWHNNHHHYPASARQGFYWWEIDVTYYFLRVLAALGLIWDLRGVPAARRAAHAGAKSAPAGGARSEP